MVALDGNVNSIILMKSFYLFAVGEIDKLHIKCGMRMKTGCAHRPSTIIAAPWDDDDDNERCRGYEAQ